MRASAKTQSEAFDDEPDETGPLAFVKRHSRLYKGLYILRRRAGAVALDVIDDPDSNFERGEGTIRAGEHEFTVGYDYVIRPKKGAEPDWRAIKESVPKLISKAVARSAKPDV